MNKLSVIGVGSPFGDDQLGWQVVELLQADPLPHVEYISCDRPGLSLVELIKDKSEVHIIDALVSGDEVGTIYRFDNTSSIENILPTRLSSHGFGILDALSLSDNLYQLPSRWVIHAIEIVPNRLDGNLSSVVNTMCHEIAARIRRELMLMMEKHDENNNSWWLGQSEHDGKV